MTSKASYDPVAFADSLPTDGWTKSSFSGGGNPNGCVEWQPLPDGGMALRDSIYPTQGALKFNAREWDNFVNAVKAGEAG